MSFFNVYHRFNFLYDEFQAILVYSWIFYDHQRLGSYIYPDWAVALGWIISFASVAAIPITACFKFLTTKGRFSQVVLALKRVGVLGK